MERLSDLRKKLIRYIGIPNQQQQFYLVICLNEYLKTIEYNIVGLNQYAKKYQDELNINKNLIFKNQDNFYGTTSAGDIIDILNEKKQSSIYISLDSKKRAYLFWFII